ncbi:MAG: response regulator [Paucimonas sp.]|jgi:PAS domain S-box-containing protein|nr:response regulator [Paucimonas sp.]
MREAILRHAWHGTPLGPLVRWPAPLRIAVDMLLLSPFPSALVWGPDLTVIHNDAYLALQGATSGAQGERFDTLWAAAWPSMGASVFQALEGQGSLVDRLALPVSRNGQSMEVCFTCCYSPVRDDHGVVSGFLHTLIETQAAEWQAAVDVILMLDGQQRIAQASPAWTRLLGWQAPAEVPVSLPELMHPADRTEVQLALDGDTPSFDARMRHKEGHYCWLRWSVVPGSSLPVLIGRDLTGERNAVQRFAEAALLDSQHMATVVKLAGDLGHEMNSVLFGISSSLELLERRLAQGRLERLDSYVQVARESAERAIGLTRNLLAYARSQPLAPTVLDVNRLLRETEPLLRQTLGTEMRLHWQLDMAPWLVQLDTEQLRKALLHLCANARDACLGRGQLTVRTINERLAAAPGERPGLAPGDYVVVHVEDDGHGMSADDIARAFEPFFTSKPLGQGAGLGLPMVHGFVQQSGGQIWIESDQERGTRVVMMFPRSLDSLPQPLAQEPLPLANGERVLLVDDETNLRGLMKEVLVEQGYEVCDVEDANAALGKFRHEGPYDLVITDIGLPGGFSGRQVARAMRMLEPQQKILFITGFTEEPVEQRLLDEPGTALLLKPFRLETLAHEVRRLLHD